MKIFTGKHPCKVSQSRLSIPKPFRDVLLDGENGNKIFLRYSHPFIEFWPIWEIEKLSEEVNKLSLLDPSSIEKMSNLGPFFYEHTFDPRNGRLKIQESLIKEINLQNQVIFEGCIRIFRIQLSR